MNNTKFFFLGGIFPKTQIEYIHKNSKGVIQNAADALQKNILIGLNLAIKDGVCLINLPFVGSYPRLFSYAYFPGVTETIKPKSIIRGIGFLNIFGLKIFFRFFSSLYALIRYCSKDRAVLFIYSAHLPFIFSSILFKYINPSIKVCLVLPDLPEYMGDGGFIYRVLKKIDSILFYYSAKKIDYFVVLTKFMAEKMQIDREKFVVIEGIASSNNDYTYSTPIVKNSIKSFLYTGTLARRYGITDLVDAFSKIDDATIELWICGDGDGKDYVLTATRRDSRIKYFGQIERNEVLDLQAKATALVNPRTPEGEFTKYSFPSKVIEYMASGRPVIMHKLPGIPEEYEFYYIAPKGIDVDALSKCIKLVAEMDDDQLSNIGQEARNFILREKNPLKQAKKILNLVMENHK